MVSIAIIAAAGKGTRLMPTTKEQPKEMLPIISQGSIKPILHLIIEQLHSSGINKILVITGRGKRAVQDHFIQDYSLLEELSNHNEIKKTLEDFYDILSKISISYINQPMPQGFGAATQLAETYVNATDPFFLSSGDSIVFSLTKGHSTDFVRRLTDAQQRYDADAALAYFKTKDTSKYGVIIGTEIVSGVVNVTKIIEKPKEYISDSAVVGKYVFKPIIFQALRKTGLGLGGEKQLTDAIGWLIDKGFKVVAIPLHEDEVYLDIGNPQTYVEALVTTALFDTNLKGLTVERFNKLYNFYNDKREKNEG